MSYLWMPYQPARASKHKSGQRPIRNPKDDKVRMVTGLGLPPETGRIIDTIVRPNHDADKRTTIDILGSGYRFSIGLARHAERRLRQAGTGRIRRDLEPRPADVSVAALSLHGGTGLPVVRSERAITADDVRSVGDSA